MKIDVRPGTRAYKHGLTKAQAAEFSKLIADKGPIPYIVWPNLCGRCGALWPEMFMVPDKEWEAYIDPSHRREMVCLDCWNHIKKVVHEGLQQVSNS